MHQRPVRPRLFGLRQQAVTGDSIIEICPHFEFADFDKLIGSMRLVDRARAKDDGRHAAGADRGRVSAKGNADPLAFAPARRGQAARAGPLRARCSSCPGRCSS